MCKSSQLKLMQAGGQSWKRHAFSIGRITGFRRRVLELSFILFFVEKRRIASNDASEKFADTQVPHVSVPYVP